MAGASRDSKERIYLSPPHLSGRERGLVDDAFTSNWIAPLGPHVDAFEREMAELVGAGGAVALSSGTAALHLALLLSGVGAGDEVFTSTLTFAATVNPICYLGGVPVFIDSDRATWNMDPELLSETLHRRAREGRLPKAVLVVHVYGQSADLKPISSVCDDYGVTLIEDAAEALGATYLGRHCGTFGKAGVFSFNGNKILTCSGGGVLVSDDYALIERARNLAAQARDPAPHYEHSAIGFNYRMSNILAAIGRGQLPVLEGRVQARRRNFESYREALGELPGIEFMPEAKDCRHTRWLTVLTIDPDAFGADREDVRLVLESSNIEARPVWKPMHLQPIFKEYEVVGGDVADRLFERGLCLPSGSALSSADVTRVVSVISGMCRQ